MRCLRCLALARQVCIFKHVHIKSKAKNCNRTLSPVAKVSEVEMVVTLEMNKEGELRYVMQVALPHMTCRLQAGQSAVIGTDASHLP